jgi:cytosine/adenosine deaminase-related metal-dependent hydrolase
LTRVLSADWVIPVDAPPIRDGAVAIEDGRIAAVGLRSELGAGERFEEAVILPGFVNAHSHLEYAVYAGFGDGLPFAPWIALHIARKAELDVPEMEAVARAGAVECLRSGITTVGDASYSGAAATACAELGLRGTIYLEVFGAGTEQIETRFEANRDRILPVLSDRVRLGISPHSVYSASPELWTAAARLGLPMMTHLAESEAEVEWVRDRSGPFAELLGDHFPPGSIRLLAERGLLGSQLVAAHAVHLDKGELELLARYDVAVVHCPRSNALLGCGIAPLAELRDADLRVGIGTDSPASTPSFDMFDELRTALSLTRARERRTDALTTTEALELATLGSATALGLEAEVGSLTPGKRADLAILSLADSPYLPWEVPEVAVVFGGAPNRVILTMVDGEVRYKKGDFEWHEQLRRRAASARRQMLHAGPAPVVAEARP